MQLAGKVAVVTGGASGIGRGIALRFAREGAAVSLVDINAPSMQAVADEIRAASGKVLTNLTDVRSSSQMAGALERTVSELGGLDVVVTSAGVMGGSPFLELAEADWQHMMDTNLKGTFLSAQAAARVMVHRGKGGRIITIASINSFWALEKLGAYCASKGGVAMLTRVMALELGEFGITANAICPGPIHTRPEEPLTEIRRRRFLENGRIVTGRFGTPDDIAGLATYLASDESQYMTGALLVSDGGVSIH